MTNQQGAPEALRPELLDDLIETFATAGLGRHNLMRVELPRHQWAQLAVALSRLHAENERLAAMVEAQQPAAHVQSSAEIENVAGDVSKNGPESNMAQQPAPSAAAVTEVENLRKALQFYADKDHFNIADDGAWDTVSGEPQNYWCDEEGTATVEDGTIARLALAGHQIKFDADEAPQPSPTPQADSQPAPVRDERDDFEKVFPLPSGCIRCGTGYASTGYSNWAAHTHVERWQGWQARAARTQADSAPAWASQAVIEYRYTGGTHWCPLGPAERMKPNFDGVYRLQGGVFPVEAPADSVTAPAGPGWQLVPTDPTNEMLDAARRACEGRMYPQDMRHGPRAMMADRYNAMLAAAPTQTAQAADSVLDRARIREIFMAHGFTVKEGQTDLKQYVYDAADALLDAARKQGANHD